MTEADTTPHDMAVALRHVLLINLGRGNRSTPPPHYDSTTYQFPDGQECSTNIAGMALWWWLERTGRPPRAVLFACTDTAWQDKAEAAQAEAARLGLNLERIDHRDHEVPRALEQVWKVLPPLEEWLCIHGARPGQPLVLHVDLTHAFRAIPLAHTWMSLYLKRRGLITPGVWGYGAYDPSAKALTPYLDLSHLLDLAEWADAVKAFRERLDTDTLASLLDPLERSARRAAAAAGSAPPGHLSALVRAARGVSQAFRAGLPLEVGLAAREHLGGTTAAAVREAAATLEIPQVTPMAEELFGELEPLAVASIDKKDAKRHLQLNEEEIERQLRVVKAFARAGMLDSALRALRELMVNRVLLAWASEGANWLDRSLRERASRRLGALATKPAPRPLSAAEQQLATLWRELRNRRNPLAHAGMQTDTVNPGEARRALESRLLPEFQRLHGSAEVWQLADLPENLAGEDEDS